MVSRGAQGLFGWLQRAGVRRKESGKMQIVEQLEEPKQLDEATQPTPSLNEIVRHAHTSASVGKYEDALLSWTDARTRFAEDARGWVGSVNTLLLLGREAEAASVMALGREYMPTSAVLHALAGRIAMQRHDLAGALELWQHAVEADNENSHYRSGLIATLLRLRQLGQAELVLEEASAAAAQQPALIASRAQIAMALGRWSEAISAWTSYIEALPASSVGPAGLGRALCNCKRFAAAEAVLRTARAEFPHDIGVAIAFALVATSCRAWKEARSRWRDVLAIAPSDPMAVAQLENCEQRIAMRDPELTSILDGFVSLGRNCEFGLFQKEFDSDKPSLLRWATTGPEMLLAGLSAEFAGLGAGESTSIAVNREEYQVTDTRFGIAFHTFINVSEAPEQEVHRRQSRRIRLQTEKLINELRCGNKIFVYQQANLTDETAIAIHDALLAFGPHFLLCVRQAELPALAGSFNFPRERLMIAEIEHEGNTGGGWDICVSQWNSFCRAAHGAWRGEGSQSRRVAPDLTHLVS